MDTIPIPPRTCERLEALLTERNSLNKLIEAIVSATAEALNVPANYELFDLRVGWQPRIKHAE